MQGAPLPTAPGSGRERVLCEWDSQFPGYGMHLRSIYRDGWLCTVYEPSTVGEPNGLEEFFAATGMFGGGIGPISSVAYDGTEGELYNVDDDPHQWENRWDDPACKALREDLVADLYDSLPAERKRAEGRTTGVTRRARVGALRARARSARSRRRSSAATRMLPGTLAPSPGTSRGRRGAGSARPTRPAPRSRCRRSRSAGTG